ncbi:MAG: biotin attachment protein [Chloroflexi bacterium]|nr:biotin attachment protein [Chloroflexota bacterium]
MVDNAKVYLITVRGRTYRVEVGDLSRSPVEVKVDGEAVLVELPAPEEATPHPSTATRVPPTAAPVTPPPGPAAPAAPPARAVKAPMPGKILAVRVKMGDHIHRGDEICVLEAMKMEQAVRSTTEGVVRTVRVQEGQTVAFGDTMVELA